MIDVGSTGRGQLVGHFWVNWSVTGDLRSTGHLWLGQLHLWLGQLVTSGGVNWSSGWVNWSTGRLPGATGQGQLATGQAKGQLADSWVNWLGPW